MVVVTIEEPSGLLLISFRTITEIETKHTATMDFETQRKKRMQDLEEKRRRLEEMRKSRKDRAETTEDAGIPSSSSSGASENQKAATAPSSSSSSAASASGGSSSIDERARVDDLVNSLLVAPVHEQVPSSSTTATPPPPPLHGASSSVDRKQAARDKAKTFTVTKCQGTIHILPTVKETYNKSIQTEANDEDDDDVAPLQLDATIATPHKRSSGGSSSLGGSPLPTAESIFHHSPPKRKTLSEDDTKDILTSDDFRSFVQTTSRLVERTLCQLNGDLDVFRDYTATGDAPLQTEGKLLTYRTSFDGQVEQSVKGRPVMDIQCSPHYGELFLAAYGSARTHLPGSGNNSGTGSGNGMEGSPGMVAVWSLGLPTRPEFVFMAPSPVLTARFHSEDPHLLVGGCYSGQLLLWDMRMKALPVQRSSMSGKGHKHPIYGMTVTGAGPSLELITASTDGMVCHWDLARISEPTNISYLTHPSGHSGHPHPASGLAAVSGGMTNASSASGTASLDMTSPRH